MQHDQEETIMNLTSLIDVINNNVDDLSNTINDVSSNYLKVSTDNDANSSTMTWDDAISPTKERIDMNNAKSNLHIYYLERKIEILEESFSSLCSRSVDTVCNTQDVIKSYQESMEDLDFKRTHSLSKIEEQYGGIL